MTDLLLAKQKLQDGFIDLTVGEARIIKDTFAKHFHSLECLMSDLGWGDGLEYPPPNGYAPLVKLLEDRHEAPVVITNGAKQALGATFYALRKMGKEKLGMRNPYWALIPPLAKAHGLECSDKYDCYLAVLPNNPDGFSFNYPYMKWLSNWHKDLGIPFIHDAAYYTPIYLPEDYHFGDVGDVQIFSMSKMYGLSGLRVGYAVCHNRDYYNLIQEYVETMTAGVSVVSQDICHQVLMELHHHPLVENTFIKQCKGLLYATKSIAKTIDKSILEVPDDVENIPGMFLWAKVKKNVFHEAKVNVAPGKYFGDDAYVRLNLAVDINQMIEVVRRLNSFK